MSEEDPEREINNKNMEIGGMEPSRMDFDNIKRFALLKFLFIALAATIFVVSLLLNFSLLFTDIDSHASGFNTSAWVVIIGLLVICTISIGISFWMYYIRTLLLRDGPALVPERWGLILQDLIKTIEVENKKKAKALKLVLESQRNQSSKSESLLESFLTLQQALSTRDSEIERLKKGYDAKIFKRFLMRFIRVSRSLYEIRKETKDKDEVKNYKYLCRLIEDALEECGVELYLPEINQDYRDAGRHIADDPSIVDTDDPEQDFKIASVDGVGYILRGEEDIEVIVPARVSIYRVKR